IVHACGFDSIPSDLGTLQLHHAAERDGAGTLGKTTLVVAALRDTLSGGTFASLAGTVDDVMRDRALRRILGDPYALSPDRAEEPNLGKEQDLRGVEHDSDLGAWIGPFLMAPANTRVVRRSNALQGWAYGREFRYREVTRFGTGPMAPLRAAGMSAAIGGLIAGLATPLTKPVLRRFLPKPGEGPSVAVQRNGFFRLELHTTTSQGVRYTATVAANGDPGYRATAVMLGESALALVLDRDRLPRRGGVLTPATALGEPLVQRLRAAGHTYSVSRDAA
ncbi:MAG: enoyl-ACP reductase, partial [Candidatus Dormibacteraeota bacterium]|nr:enoyl-ACP reductase [Candidatus Dormibacteraeota bacterium]